MATEINFIRPQEVYDTSASTSQLRYKGFDGKFHAAVSTADIADNLTTNSANKALSAKQGKVLDEAKIEAADLKTILGNTATGSGNITAIVSTTHAALAAAKTAGSLLPGTLYLVTDYPLGESDPTGDVLVLATANNALNTNVWVMPAVAYADPTPAE